VEGVGGGVNLSTYLLSSAKVKNEWSHMSAPAVCIHGACEGDVLLSLPLPINK
jgi:hypothetical protein